MRPSSQANIHDPYADEYDDPLDTYHPVARRIASPHTGICGEREKPVC
jgi:hypothetical protein